MTNSCKHHQQDRPVILVTGGCGYIGSHTVLALLENGFSVVVADNLINSSIQVLDSLEELAGMRPDFFQIDVCSENALRSLFQKNQQKGTPIHAVIHFAGLKAVGESVQIPLEYYSNNLGSTLSLLKIMKEFQCWQMVFSSSATVYGNPAKVPISEDFPLSTTNPYGTTKLMIENILKDLAAADSRWDIALLRYFNPAGAHPSGLLGEDPKGIPNNLIPYISQVAIGKLQQLSVYGDDYPTPDGTGVRDYIHVMDLAEGHLAALKKLREHPGLCIYNLGTGHGYSVLDMIHAFEKACGHPIPYVISPRRLGDIAVCYADPTKAQKDLGWIAKRNLDAMMQDAWNWQTKNPNGFAG